MAVAHPSGHLQQNQRGSLSGVGFLSGAAGRNASDNRHTTNVLEQSRHKNHLSMLPAGSRSSYRPQRGSALLPLQASRESPAFRASRRQSSRLQLLNFESSNQSIFHSVLPIGLGLSMVKEDTSVDEEATSMHNTVFDTHKSQQM